MNIGLIVNDISLLGGVEIVTMQMAEYEKKKGNRVFIITCRNTRQASFDSFKICNMNIPSGISVLQIQHIHKICSVIEKACILRVMIQLNDPYRICLLANVALNQELSKLAEVYVTIHNSPKSALTRYRLYHENYLLYKLKQIYSVVRYSLYAKKYVQKSSKCITSFITLSSGCQNELKTYFGVDSVVRYNPYSWQESDDIQKNNTVLWAGRLARDKNIYLLLDAWKRTCHDGWKLKIIGDGPDRKKVIGFIRKEKISDIELTGELSHEEVLCEMKKSKIFVLTSFREGFPTVIPEAQNMKNAVITVRYDGFSEELLNQENCICVKYSAREIARGLEKLLKDEDRLKQLQENGYQSCYRFYKQRFEREPLVSILMSVYNEDVQYLKEAMDSIIYQTYRNLEIILVNDCCNDCCSKILEEYARKDSRIVLIRNKQNMGLTKSLNTGLKYVNGKYLARMDSDDVALYNRIERQVCQMEKKEKLIVCGTWACSLKSEKRINLMRCSDNHELTAVRMMFFNAGVIHPTAMIRTAFLKEEQIKYNEKYKRAQDYALWSEIIYRGGKIETLPDVLLKYRIHAGQTTSVFREEQNFCARMIRIENLERNLGVSLSEREKELYHALAEQVMSGTVRENIRMIRKIELNTAGVHKGYLKKELLINWWRRGIKCLKGKDEVCAGYFLNRYALSILRPNNFIYLFQYFVLKK